IRSQEGWMSPSGMPPRRSPGNPHRNSWATVTCWPSPKKAKLHWLRSTANCSPSLVRTAMRLSCPSEFRSMLLLGTAALDQLLDLIGKAERTQRALRPVPHDQPVGIDGEQVRRVERWPLRSRLEIENRGLAGVENDGDGGFGFGNVLGDRRGIFRRLDHRKHRDLGSQASLDSLQGLREGLASGAV